jgi:hypothetical protein
MPSFRLRLLPAVLAGFGTLLDRLTAHVAKPFAHPDQSWVGSTQHATWIDAGVTGDDSGQKVDRFQSGCG